MNVRTWKTALAVACLAFSPALAQDGGAAIRDVISRQVEAFRADDAETAFGFASPMIKEMFGDADRFARMVREGYPMVWNPAEMRFGALSEDGGKTVQSVLMTDGSGALFVLDYEMSIDDAGWRIDGVTIRRTGAAGV